MESQQSGKLSSPPILPQSGKRRCQLIVSKPKRDMKLLLKELAPNDMLKTMFPNLSKFATICLSIPVATALVERSFSQMKVIKTQLRSNVNYKSLSHLMKIAIEYPAELTNSHLKEDVDIWNRKSMRIAV